MTLDWTKPIQFKNGEPCELVGVMPNGTQFGKDITHIINRIGVTPIEAATWFYPASGECKEGSSTKEMGYDIVNVSKDAEYDNRT